MEDREYELKQAELALRDREVAAREREVATRETDVRLSRWKSPLAITLVGAFLALFTGIGTTFLNNRAAIQVEKMRNRSDLMLAAIRTNGNDEDTCRNLYLSVRLGLLDDPSGAIKERCGEKGETGVPALPASSSVPVNNGTGGYGVGGYGLGGFGIGAINRLTVKVEDEKSSEPIPNAKVDVERLQPLSQLDILTGHPLSFESKVIESTVTDAKGNAILNTVNSFDFLGVSSNGYESVRESVSHANSAAYSPSILVALHRASKPNPSPKP